MAQENIKLSADIEQLSEKLAADPKSRIFAQLADAYRKAGLLDEAIDTAKKGLENHPNYAVAHLILGRCYLSKGMYALAREEFELTIKSDPQNLVGYKLLGETYEKQNMYPEALKYYQMILDLEPADAELAQKIADLKNLKQPEPSAPEPETQPEPQTEATPAEQEVIPSEARTEQPSPVMDIPPMPEVLQAAEEPAAPAETAEPITLPPVLEQETASAATEETADQKTPETEEKSTEAAVISEGPKPEVAAAEDRGPESGNERRTDAADESQGPTSTLAEIYVQQGFLEKAIDIYKELIAAQPDNEDYKTRMDELLTKAYPEEAPVLAPTPETAPETQASKEELIGVPSIADAVPPVVPEEIKSAPAETVAAEDPFAKLFGQAAPVEEPPAPPAEPASEPEVSPPSPEPPAVDFGALFNEAQAPKPDDQVKPAEPEKPAPEVKVEDKPEEKPAGSSESGEDAVSSFQSWLSQIQK